MDNSKDWEFLRSDLKEWLKFVFSKLRGYFVKAPVLKMGLWKKETSDSLEFVGERRSRSSLNSLFIFKLTMDENDTAYFSR